MCMWAWGTCFHGRRAERRCRGSAEAECRPRWQDCTTATPDGRTSLRCWCVRCTLVWPGPPQSLCAGQTPEKEHKAESTNVSSCFTAELDAVHTCVNRNISPSPHCPETLKASQEYSVRCLQVRLPYHRSRVRPPLACQVTGTTGLSEGQLHQRAAGNRIAAAGQWWPAEHWCGSLPHPAGQSENTQTSFRTP